jgi:hypothetical protein
MEIAIVVLLSLNLFVTAYFGIRFLMVQSENAKFRLEYFESTSDRGLIRKTNKVTLHAQIFYGPLPIGSPTVLGEKTVDRIDEAELQLIKNEIIRPFARLGIKVLEMKTGVSGILKSKVGG